jgi:hypothetical protein
MAYFRKTDNWDWCHLCGARQTRNVEVWKPPNAEHQEVNTPIQGATNFLRICADCGEAIARVGRGEVEEMRRNNPALRRPAGMTRWHVEGDGGSRSGDGGGEMSGDYWTEGPLDLPDLSQPLIDGEYAGWTFTSVTSITRLSN